jgi:dynein heavy chain
VQQDGNLVPDEQFLLKIQQLDELLVIRHCIFVIGTSGNGKSSVWGTLAKTWTKLGRPTLVRDINPKAISANELYGYIQLATREWKDGLLSNQMRELAEMPDTNPKWCGQSPNSLSLTVRLVCLPSSLGA